jgi:6-pyruvoyltetrahydropterin/6-carboxytetrahydropterin synthase
VNQPIAKFLRYWDAYRETYGVSQSNDHFQDIAARTDRINAALDEPLAAVGLPPEVSPTGRQPEVGILMASVTVRVEWEMGHRLPNHRGGCKNLHGHHYIADVTVEGQINKRVGAPDEGMVVDFSEVKNRLREVVKTLDHQFMLATSDPLLDSMMGMPGVFGAPFIPTAENIAWHLLSYIPEASKVRLYETPTSYAEVERA